MVRVLIGGDICPLGRIEDSFANGNSNEIFHDLLMPIESADLSIVNLECPLISRETPIKKSGPVLGASRKCINGFTSAKWDVLNLANNHSFDHGRAGLLETINTIKSAGLNVVGAGMNIEDAQTPYVAQINGERIVIYSMAEREFSVADENMPGANPLDLINFVSAVRLYKQGGKFIALIHGGNEYYPYPSPEMARRCRFMIDLGADAVICCHTHCALPWELYAGKPIIYGLGNLVFESTVKEPDYWYEGYLALLTIDEENIAFEAIPYCQSKTALGAQKMEKAAQERFFNEMIKKSRQISDRTFLKNQWKDFCRQNENSYLSMLFAHNRLIHKLRNLLVPTLHTERAILRSLLLVQCEAHREVLTTIFNNKKRNPQ